MTANSTNNTPRKPNGNLEVGILRKRPDFANLLGEFIARWSLCEHALVLTVLRIQGGKQEVAAAMLAATNSTEGKIKLVKSMIKASGLENRKEKSLIDSLKQLEKLCETRNSISHHVWAVDNDEEVFTIDHRQQDGNSYRITHWDTEKIKELCNASIKAAIEINNAADASWITSQSLEHYSFP